MKFTKIQEIPGFNQGRKFVRYTHIIYDIMYTSTLDIHEIKTLKYVTVVKIHYNMYENQTLKNTQICHKNSIFQGLIRVGNLSVTLISYMT